MQAQPQHEYLVREKGIGLWLGLLPFLLMSLVAIVQSLPLGWWGERTYLASSSGQILIYGYLVILAGMYFGIKAGFPLWAYPYLVYGWVFAVLLSTTSTPGFEIFGFEMWGGQPWGARTLIPLLALVLLVWRADFDLGRLVDDLCADWTRLSFGLYMMLPFIVWLGMDGLQVNYKLMGLIQAELIFTLGALLYLRQRSRRGRLFSLLACAFVGYLVGAGVVHLFWSTYSVNMATGARSLLPGPVPLASILVNSSFNALLATLFVLLPGVFGLRQDRQPLLEA